MKNKKQTLVAGLGMLALAVFLLLPVTASAQGQYRNGRWENNQRDRDDWRRRNRDNDWRRGGVDMRQTALNAGYNNGIQEGRKDRQHGDRFEYRDEGDFRDATEDYNSRYGNRELYRQYFRQGFANGYRDGYRGN